MAIYEVQPAYKIYAFDRGWRIMQYVTENLFKRTDLAARWWFNKARNLISSTTNKGSFIKYWAYVIVGGLGLAGAAQYVSAMLLAALFLAVQAIVLSVWVGISVLIMGSLAVCTFTYSTFYRIFFRCPDCHKEMPIPTYICPKCGTEHTRLWPSIYGISAHRCKTCNTKLPTLGPLGRNKISRICPHCRRPLNVGVGAGTNIHIPLVGGPSTGKTNYIVMATNEFKQTYETLYRYQVTFTDENHKRNFEANLQRLSQGHELLKTPDIVPQAYNLDIRAPGAWVPKFAYIYDAAGEAFNTNANTSLQEYYKYIHGVIFVTDHFAIAEYRNLHKVDIELLRDSLRPSALNVMQAYERMMQMLEASIGIRKGGRYSQPIAIVVTKVDALNLEWEIGEPAAQALMAHNPSIISQEDAISILVRDFLRNYGLGNFMRDVESQFAHVKYFSCSALGRLPTQADTRSFQPIRVLDPLVWLLVNAKAIKPVQSQARQLKTRPIAIPQVQRQ